MPSAGYTVASDLRLLHDEDASRDALVSGTRRITFAGLADYGDRIGAALSAHGVCAGDRVFVLSRSSIDIFGILIGAASVGAVMTPVNWRLSSAELAAVVDDCAPAVVLADAALRHHVPALGRHVVEIPDGTPSSGGPTLDVWTTAPAGTFTPVEVGDDAPVLQIYTSGTSGQPKGVQLSNANIAAKVTHMARAWQFRPGSRSLLATPLFHIGGLSWGLISLHARVTTDAPQQVGATALLDIIRRERNTHAFMVPKMLQDLIAAERDDPLPERSLELLLCGGAAVSAELQRDAMRSLGCSIAQVYGMTETTGSITELDAGSGDPLNSCGRLYPWVELQVRDPLTKAPRAVGEFGEIWTRSAQNCLGYWRRPVETAELLEDGWLRTGDGGYIDELGRLYLTDRIKDMIISGGENIFSAEVERVLRSHPHVRDAAVVGLPDADWGEVVVAVVEPAGAEVDPVALSEHVGAQLGRYKRPRRVITVADLPRNTSGKVLKRQLRAELIADVEQKGQHV